MKTKKIWGLGVLGVIIAVVAVTAFTVSPTQQFGEEFAAMTGQSVLYKASSCGCCGVYSDYIKKIGGMDVEVKSLPDITDIKDQQGVPSNMQSCHTTLVGNYFVEGHIPLEAIQKLVEEQPDIKGIALPGMPSGTPGMPGPKTEPWIIYAINHDGSVEEFMTF